MENNNTAIILAAGLGSRLGDNTKEIPKCMVKVSGVRMIDRMILSLELLGIDEIVMAVGYLKDSLVCYLRDTYPQLNVRFVDNLDYASSGSVYSLKKVLDTVEVTNLFLVEADVVLDFETLRDFYRGAIDEAVTSTIISPYTSELSGTFCQVNDARVLSWDHETVRDESYNLIDSYKTVNITYICRNDFEVFTISEKVEKSMPK